MEAKEKKVCPQCAATLKLVRDVIPRGVGSVIPETIKEEISAARKLLSGKNRGPRIPEEKLAVTKEPPILFIEDFDHVNLREYETAEADPGDLEWTRYADKKGDNIQGTRIDPEMIPASVDGLQEILADLEQAEMFNLKGEINLESNRVDKAIDNFDHALAINPDFVDALVNRGCAYVLRNQYNDALSDFNHALDLHGRQPEIFNVRGKIYLLNGMFDEAIKDFTAAIILNPVYSDAYLNRARAHSEKGMKREAEFDCRQAIMADYDKSKCCIDPADLESLLDD